jgi:hypothetical protein
LAPTETDLDSTQEKEDYEELDKLLFSQWEDDDGVTDPIADNTYVYRPFVNVTKTIRESEELPTAEALISNPPSAILSTPVIDTTTASYSTISKPAETKKTNNIGIEI